MKVVVEGVDYPQALARVRRAGCDIGQGYLFAQSLKPDHAEDWIAQYNSTIACARCSQRRQFVLEPSTGTIRARTHSAGRRGGPGTLRANFDCEFLAAF
jgi:predicted signal transduction protein with EAL and GGDEF domain